MDNDIEYKPNAAVVRTCRSFIRSLCEAYGHTQGMSVWDSVREKLGDRAAGDIMFGMLTGIDQIRIISIGSNFIGVIREHRVLTGWGFKESKEFLDNVRDGRTMTLDVSSYDNDKVSLYMTNLRQLGAIVE